MPSGGATAAVVQCGVRLECREPMRRYQPEQESRTDRYGDEIAKHMSVHRIVEIDTIARLREHVRAHAPGGHPPADAAAQGREHHALDDELPNNAPAPCTERDADGHLSGPSDC